MNLTKQLKSSCSAILLLVVAGIAQPGFAQSGTDIPRMPSKEDATCKLK